MRSDLPEKTAALYNALKGAGDVHVIHLYEAVTGKQAQDHVRAQQFLRSYIRRLNRHLEGSGESVERGALRCTYCLIPIR